MRFNLIFVSLLLTGFSCSDNNIDDPPSTADPSYDISFKDDPAITTLNGKWKVYCIENFNNHTIEYKSRENTWGQDIIVEFNDTTTPHGFTGIKTTNTFGGEFRYVGSRQFRLKGVISTLAGQPRWANEFDKFIVHGLYDDVAFIVNDEMLRIYYHFGMKSIVLVKE